MTTRFFRFPSEAAFIAAMPAGFQREGETGFPLPSGLQAISIIGTDARDAGWHVNALGKPPATWLTYEVSPKPTTPWRTF